MLAETQEDGFRNLQADEVTLRLEELESCWTTCASVYFDMSVNFTEEQRAASAFFTKNRFERFKRTYRDVKLALLPTAVNNVQFPPADMHVNANVVNSDSSVDFYSALIHQNLTVTELFGLAFANHFCQ